MAYGRRDFFKRTVGRDAWKKLAGLAQQGLARLAEIEVRSARHAPQEAEKSRPRSAEEAGRALRSFAGKSSRKRKAPHPLTRGLAGASSASEPRASPPRGQDQGGKNGSAMDAAPPS